MPKHVSKQSELVKVALPLPAVIRGSDSVGLCMVDRISSYGLYMDVKDQVCLKIGDIVDVDLYLSDSNPDTILTLPGRISGINIKQMEIRFDPLALALDRLRISSLRLD